MVRRNDIDILKALGIVFMIMGHVEFGDMFDRIIHSFHMPLFFFLSGYLYKQPDGFHDFLTKKSRSLLIPYVLFGILHFLIKLPMLMKQPTGVTDALYHLCLFNHEGIPIAGALWFLTALFGTYIIFYFINKFRSSVLKSVAVVVLSLSGSLLPIWFRLPWSLDVSLSMLLPFYVAYRCRTTIDSLSNKSAVATISLFVGIALCFINAPVNIRDGRYGNILLFHACAVLFTLSLYCAASRYVANRDSRISHILSFIGINSLIYMSFNQLIVWFPNQYLLNDYSLTGISLKLATVCLTFCIIHPIAAFLQSNVYWNRLLHR